MPVRVLIAVADCPVVCLLFAADRTVKVIKRERRRRDASRRLAAATAQAEAKAQAAEGGRHRPAERSPRSCRPSIDVDHPPPWTEAPGAVRVVVLADTHAPRRWRACPPRVAGHLRRRGPDPARGRRLHRRGPHRARRVRAGDRRARQQRPAGRGRVGRRRDRRTRPGRAQRGDGARQRRRRRPAGAPAPHVSRRGPRGVRALPYPARRVRRPGCGSSTRDRRRTAGGSRTARSACCRSTPAA